MHTFEPGTIEKLTVSQEVGGDYVLSDGNRIVVLPQQEVSAAPEPGDRISVFIYLNKKGETIATMSLPAVTADTYEWVKVVESVKGLGVFADIGLKEDVLVSSDDLPLLESVWPKEGDELFVTLTTDKKGRLLAKPATETVVEDSFKEAPQTLKHTTAEGRVYRSTKVGSFVITTEGYRGFVHYSERKEEPRLGEWVSGRVIGVKEDGTVNMSLRPLKQEVLDEDAESVFAYLIRTGGEMPFTDKSDPDEIRDTFKISKAAFKRALGRLMKEGRVRQEDGKTFAVSNEE
ncbi:hypothetical protein CR205_06525 [Alteribacter lacisalsi]|uniref:S1 motif domain-containing protein n=1 Tax=Alteribacter lacisalsi TaxID=2045244 RepID=A0A2W0HBN5_9BACI|nr:S1-like domain-containing RNA-binding protein [Alteribacter lacisalsi]PYZ98246.1 hypothetical protein CR205_06525 [Alteribacter lacisalsi]